MRQGGSYSRKKKDATPKRLGGTQDHKGGNMARAADGAPLRRATLPAPAEAPKAAAAIKAERAEPARAETNTAKE
ncbi:hypothetical protein [Oceanibaculum indicum]|uniref:Uncharacterized protein n=1 Tax=Oceanibaculum indicum P24 TaxID=1207063 RepID=K2KLU9_9PROT|nr:hypothetical protein [Oceanibaculum indicum]EKE78430.1 hypothetical protein P24_02681 [Oceanibaculum indicum P24]